MILCGRYKHSGFFTKDKPATAIGFGLEPDELGFFTKDKPAARVDSAEAGWLRRDWIWPGIF